MAPMRPLPMGRASTHCSAGLSYQRVRSSEVPGGGWAAAEEITALQTRMIAEERTRAGRRMGRRVTAAPAGGHFKMRPAAFASLGLRCDVHHFWLHSLVT